MDTEVQSIKTDGSEKLLHPIQVIKMGRLKKKDPKMMKKLPIKVDTPEFLVKMASGGVSDG